MVSRVNEVAKLVGLSINAGNTKVFSSCIADQEKALLGIDGCQVEEVGSFQYLGVRLLPNGQSKDDIVSRIDAARRVFSSRRRDQLKTWLETVRQDMEVVLGSSVFGLSRWRIGWAKLSRSAAADHHAGRGTDRDIIEAG
ncbi:hypothetical protein SprV_0501755400 [Sparganum proliferum]